MKHPYPVHQTNTITRANITLAKATAPDSKEIDVAEKLAAYLIGHPSCVEGRHIRRVERLTRS